MKYMIKNFEPSGGDHCITNSLKQIFLFNQYNISEEMLFGIGQGIGFIYLNLKESPLLSGRIKPFEFEKNIGSALAIRIRCRRSKNTELALKNIKDQVKKNIPTMVYVDMAYLKYLNLGENNHFGGHSIVIFGFDDESEYFYVSDRDSLNKKIHTPKGKIGKNFHLVNYKDLKKALGSSFRPFPANNKWVQFDFSKAICINSNILENAILGSANSMLNAPAKLLGINGIKKFSKEIKKWEKFNNNKLRLAGITNYFMINGDGGTGGGAFRNMYGKFLKEASGLIDLNKIKTIGKRFERISHDWEDVGESLFHLYKTGSKELLDTLSKRIYKIAIEEEDSFSSLLNAF